MKKQYTKKQIQEAIAYWQKQLKMVAESADDGSQTMSFKQYLASRGISLDDFKAMLDEYAERTNSKKEDDASKIGQIEVWTRSQFLNQFKDDETMVERGDDGTTLLGLAMWMFDRGADYDMVASTDGAWSDLRDTDAFASFMYYECEFAAMEEHQSYLDIWYAIGLGDSIKSSDEVDMPRRYKVMTSWRKPAGKEDVVWAGSEDEAIQQVEQRYERSHGKSRSDSDWMFNGVEDVEEI